MNRLIIIYFLFLFLLFPIKVFATDEVEEVLIKVEDEMNLIQGRLGSINTEISEIESEINTYGEDYTYNYNIATNSLTTFNEKSSYQIQSSSFLTSNISTNISENNYELSLSEMLDLKENEKNQLDIKYQELINLKERINNFQNIVFDSSDVTKVSGMTVEDIQLILSGTKLYDLAQDFYDAEKEYGVNAFFIISICALESGWGTSSRAIRDNNLTGFGVYSDSSIGINSVTKRDNIMLTTKTLKNNYLTVGGSCYNGTSISSVNIKYCVTNTWAGRLTDIGNKLLGDLQSNFINSIISYEI